jgi:hypothetical protein
MILFLRVGVHVDQELERLRKIAAENIRYERQLARVRNAGKQTSCISEAVNKSLDNIVFKKSQVIRHLRRAPKWENRNDDLPDSQINRRGV